ncbi:MAG: ubiquitin-like small modifier protein 1 [Candidatus Thorarchaeota archaeon]
MKIAVKFYAHLRNLIGGHSVLELDVDEPTKVSQVLSKICENSKIRQALMNENEEVKADITLLKNGREIKFLDGLETTLEEGDILAIFPLVAGG